MCRYWARFKWPLNLNILKMFELKLQLYMWKCPLNCLYIKHITSSLVFLKRKTIYRLIHWYFLIFLVCCCVRDVSGCQPLGSGVQTPASNRVTSGLIVTRLHRYLPLCPLLSVCFKELWVCLGGVEAALHTDQWAEKPNGTEWSEHFSSILIKSRGLCGGVGVLIFALGHNRHATIRR